MKSSIVPFFASKFLVVTTKWTFYQIWFSSESYVSNTRIIKSTPLGFKVLVTRDNDSRSGSDYLIFMEISRFHSER